MKTNRREIMEKARKALRTKNLGLEARESMASNELLFGFQIKRSRKEKGKLK
jgi:hypothetical protein